MSESLVKQLQVFTRLKEIGQQASWPESSEPFWERPLLIEKSPNHPFIYCLNLCSIKVAIVPISVSTIVPIIVSSVAPNQCVNCCPNLGPDILTNPFLVFFVPVLSRQPRKGLPVQFCVSTGAIFFFNFIFVCVHVELFKWQTDKIDVAVYFFFFDRETYFE